MAAISSVLLGEDWFGEGSEQPGLPPEHLRHGQSGRSGWCSLIGCCDGVKPGWDVSDNCGLGARQRLWGDTSRLVRARDYGRRRRLGWSSRRAALDVDAAQIVRGY